MMVNLLSPHTRCQSRSLRASSVLARYLHRCASAWLLAHSARDPTLTLRLALATDHVFELRAHCTARQEDRSHPKRVRHWYHHHHQHPTLLLLVIYVCTCRKGRCTHCNLTWLAHFSHSLYTETGADAAVVFGKDGTKSLEYFELPNGCVCCSVRYLATQPAHPRANDNHTSWYQCS